MLEYLDNMSRELALRRETMIKNMRSGSPSFYSSFRSLCEEFVIHFLSVGGFDVTKKDKVSVLLSREDTFKYFTSRGCTEKTVSKVKDLISKINKQVHGKEKEFDTDLVVVYINVLYNFTSPFSEDNPEPPTEEEILSECFAHEKEVEKAIKDGETKSERMLDDLKDYIDEHFENIETAIKTERNVKATVDKEKSMAAVRADVIKNGSMYLVYILNGNFEKKKHTNCYMALCTVGLGLLSTFMSVAVNGVYTTFSFMQHFWQLLLLLTVFRMVFLKRTVSYSTVLEKFPTELDAIHGNVLSPVSLKSRYKFCLVLYFIGMILDIASPWIDSKTIWTPWYKFLYITFTVITLCAAVLSVIVYFKTRNIYSSYDGVVYKKTYTGGGVSTDITVCRVFGLTYTEKEFCEHYLEGNSIIYPNE